MRITSIGQYPVPDCYVWQSFKMLVHRSHMSTQYCNMNVYFLFCMILADFITNYTTCNHTKNMPRLCCNMAEMVALIKISTYQITSFRYDVRKVLLQT